MYRDLNESKLFCGIKNAVINKIFSQKSAMYLYPAYPEESN